MKPHRNISIARVLALAALLTGPVAYAANEEQQLQKEQQRIDAAAKTTAPKSESLAKEFGVTSDTVSGLRAKNRGWGEITIELAMAQQLTKTNATTYPDTNAALTKIESQRAAGAGWGKIANDLGFKLGPVVSAVQRARHEPARTERAAAKGKTERSDKGERPDRTNKPERPDRPDRPERGGNDWLPFFEPLAT